MKPSVETLEHRTLLASVAINPATQFQTIQGMGAGLATYNTRQEYTDPAFYDRIVNDLGATATRWAILPTFEGANDNNDPNTFDFSKFDLTTLGAMMGPLQAMKERGVTLNLGTVWSPPWWMKTNQSLVQGGMLRPDMRAEYAEYLAAVVQVAKNSFGIDVSAISPQNEPFFVEPYDSTVYNADQFREIIRAMGNKFDALGLNTKIVGNDDLNYEDRASWYYNAIMKDPETAGDLDVITGHTLGGRWEQYARTIAPFNKPYWQTETSGEAANWAGAISMAEGIHNALVIANAEAYFYWQYSEDTWAPDRGLMINGNPTPKFYAAKQFFRWVRPGMKRISVTSDDPKVLVSGFKDPSTGATTIVLINQNASATNVGLSGSGLPSTYKQYRSSSSENAAFIGNFSGSSINLPASSITTLYAGADFVTKTGGAPSNLTVPHQWAPTDGKPLSTAALNGDFNTFMAEVEGKDVNETGPTGWTPLLWAAASPQGGAPAIIEELIKRGVNIGAKNSEGMTALHVAASNGLVGWPTHNWQPVEKINMLLSKGAQVNLQDGWGRTALHYAARNGRSLWAGANADPSMVNALLLAGADPSIKDGAGKTALDYAIAEGYGPIADAIRAYMGDTTQKVFRDPIIVGDGEQWFEAEDFDWGGEGVSSHDTDPTNTAGDYRPGGVDMDYNVNNGSPSFALANTKAGEWVEYTAKFIYNGTYDLFFYASSPVNGGMFHLEVDGVDKTGPIGIPNTGSTFLWSEVKKAGVQIPFGTHTLKLVFDSSPNGTAGNITGIKIKPMIVTPPDQQPPPDQTPFKNFNISKSGPTTIQVEDFDNGGDGVAYHDVDSSNNGGQYRSTGVDIQTLSNDSGTYNVGWTRGGEWLEYTVNVTEAGLYDLAFRVACGVQGGKFHLEVDGTDVTGQLTVPNTGDFQNWTTVTKAGVSLSQGQHVLKLSLDAGGAGPSVGNFNSFTLTPQNGPVSPPPPPPPPPGQAPFGASPISISSSGSTTIQFENYDLGGEGVAYHDDDTVNTPGLYRPNDAVDVEGTTDLQGGYNVGYVRAGEWLEYTITVPTAGNYDLGFRVANTGADAKFHAEIDGANVTGALTVPNTFGWQSWQTVTKSGVALAQGEHVLRVAFDSIGTSGAVGNFNYISVAPATVVNPPDQTPFKSFNISRAGPTTIQVEDFDNGADGVAYHDVDPTNNGGQYRTNAGVDIEFLSNDTGTYNVGYTRGGEWLEYTVNVTEAGTYDLGFRVACGVQGGKFHLEVDGADVTGQLTVPNTGGFQNWTTVTKTGVSLAQGTHVLRLSLDAGGSGPSVGNLNQFTITPQATQPPPTGPQTPLSGLPFQVNSTGTTTIQAEDFDNGGETVAYHDSDAVNTPGAYRATGVDVENTADAGGGFDVGYTLAGEWLEYTINVATAGDYDLGFRVASSGNGGMFHAEIDGTDVTGALTLPNTFGWQTWNTVNKTGVSLAAGQHVLRLAMDSVGATGAVGNFNYITIKSATTTPTNPVVLTNSIAAYVQDGGGANTNFGNDPSLLAKTYTTVGTQRDSYLKFDLSSVTTINSARLSLWGSLSSTASGNVVTNIYGASNTTWAESTITWNNRPALGPMIATTTMSGTDAHWYEFDITNYLKAEKAAGRNIVTLVIHNPNNSTAVSVFNSDDASSNKPQVIIT